LGELRGGHRFGARGGHRFDGALALGGGIDGLRLWLFRYWWLRELLVLLVEEYREQQGSGETDDEIRCPHAGGWHTEKVKDEALQPAPPFAAREESVRDM